MQTKQAALEVQNLKKSFKIPLEATSGLKQKLINTMRGRKGYRVFTPLDGISFEIEKGDFFGIVGRNGSGKSTLLKTIAGIYTPNEGSVSITGSLIPFIELGVGFNPELTGRENVFLNGALLGFSRSDMLDMYDDIVEFAELHDFMDERLKNYSSGMQVRLAFSIAIKAEADILLLDEVLAVGDAAFQRKCYDYFMSLKGKKQTVVLVTHDMNAVRRYCDKAIMLEKGKIVKIGNVDDVAQEYQKLFMQADESTVEQSKDIWGEGGLRLYNAEVKVGTERVTIKTTYMANKNLPPPVYGITLYNNAGTNVLEANTLKENIKTKPIQKGDKVSLEWEFQNILSDGSYNISVACCDLSVTRYYQWVNKAVSFSVKKHEITGGVVDPQISVVMNEVIT
ncbi:ABC transporter ATP-binding protein [Candidatus Saccharibacteria bacterium]|nr:MAG: ABC transporter ATP-binding protein [Candidatus Saccharibacteria bacterium]